MPAFASALSKLARAKHHIQDFEEQATRFLRANRHVAIQDDPKTNHRSIEVVGDKPIPDDFGLIIGDAVHCLRCALDHVVWEAVSPHLEANHDPRKVQFPFPKKKEGLESAITSSLIHLAGLKFRTAIEATRPYPGGDDALVSLHMVDNSDKHRVIYTVAELVHFAKMNPNSICPTAPNITFENMEFGGTNKLIRWDFPSHLTRQQRRAAGIPAHGTRISATFDIRFGDSHPMAHASVRQTLARLHNAVEDAISKISGALNN